MLVELVNTPRPYAWGDVSMLASWQSRPKAESPEAELWLGTHAGSEAHVRVPSGHEELLSSFLESHGYPRELPFLVKLLAAATPLSLQVHPTLEQAKQGFAAEEAMGVERSGPNRNYKDESDKPEVLIAWSKEFEALVGFQESDAIAATLDELDILLSSPDSTEFLRHALQSGFQGFVELLLGGGEEISHLARHITEAASHSDATPGSHTVWRTWSRVVPHFPHDPGIVLASFLNHVTLRKGEALFVPAGVVHAYLRGFGLEVMAPSDNVVRGGLTEKYVDRAELANLVSRDAPSSVLCLPRRDADSSEIFQPEGVAFNIRRLVGSPEEFRVSSMSPAVLVIEEGSCNADWEGGSAVLQKGHGYAWLPLSGASLSLRVDGRVYIVAHH